MKDNRDQIDEMIKETLSREEAAFYDSLEEQNLIGKIGEIYRGKLGWLAIVMNVVNLLIFAAFVYCLIQFLGTDETNALIRWSAAGFICMIAMGMLKVYFWMQMNKNDVLRELKRLEIQVATLMSGMDRKS